MAERRFKVQTTGEMRPIPRQPVLGAIADVLTSAKPVIDKSFLSLVNAAGLQDYFGSEGQLPEAIPLLGGSAASDLILGESPEELERISYGDYPIRMKQYGRLNIAPTIKPGRAGPLMDLAFTAAPMAKPAARGLRAIPEGLKMAGEDLLKAGVTGAPSIVKRRGGQWISSDVGRSPEAVAEALKLDNPIGPEKSVNDWFESTLTKYIKRDLGTAEDPVRALAEKGVLHYEPTPLTAGAANIVKNKRTAQLGQSELAKKWEDISDLSVGPFTAGEMRQRLTAEELEEMPWILNVPAETPVYEISSGARFRGHKLGMLSLRDQLLNAVDPESSLPKNLQLRPESLSRMSMPQAVEHVAKINKWKADNASKKALAAAEGIPVHKEYAEGFKWLSPGDTRKDKKAMQYIKEAGCDLGWCTKEEGAALNYGSGDSRVYILSDKKGKPLAQISTVEKEGELPDIQEIQGPFNKPPTGDALKYVQDFVKSKKWGFVGDPERVGLLEIGGQFMTQPELERSIGDAIKAVSSKRPSTGNEAGLQSNILSVLHEYGTKDLDPQDISNALDDARSYIGKGAGFAKGGSVDLAKKYGVRKPPKKLSESRSLDQQVVEHCACEHGK